MAELKGKLTPAEFLAALKGRKPPAKHIAPPESESEEGELSDVAAGQSELEEESQEPHNDRAANEDSGDGSGSVPSKYFGNYIKRSSRLSELFDRVNTLLGSNANQDPGETFRPKSPETLNETGLTFEEVERLILSFFWPKAPPADGPSPTRCGCRFRSSIRS